MQWIKIFAQEISYINPIKELLQKNPSIEIRNAKTTTIPQPKHWRCIKNVSID